MPRFLEQSDAEDVLYLEDTDKPLPEKLSPGNRYMHFKTIARGGKAILQSCKDLYMGRTVCYKQLKPEFQKNEIEQLRFLREARISAQLQHPSTIPTYELGRDIRGNPYFTMKLVHGYTLREVLDYRERYDLGQLLNIVTQVAQALAYAHAHGVIHRDIKPENILVGPFGEVLLMDWGLAKVWAREPEPGATDSATREATINISNQQVDSSMTGLGGLEGTVTYMSPEQLRQDPAIDGRSDIFTLGAVLYEVICGQTATQADTVREMHERILEETPAPPSTLFKGDLPQLLDEVVMRCLHKQPSQRFNNCLEIVRLLQEVD